MSASFTDPSRVDTRAPDVKLRDELLTCKVCKKNFNFGKRNPHMLPCGDVACQDCLRQFAGRGGKALSMFCPICDRNIQVPGGHICCFPNDEDTLTILEVYKLVEAYKTDFVPCIGCDLNADARCLECRENYCEDHANFHSITSATKGHTIVKFMDILADPAKILRANGIQMCAKHVENALDAVCGTCNSLVCLVCALTEHRGHNIKEVAETVGVLKERIAPILEKVETKHYDTKQVHGMAMDVTKQLGVLFQRTKRDCNITYMGMIRSLRDRQLELFDVTDEFKKANHTILLDQERAIEDEIAFTIRGQDTLKDLYENLSPTEMAGLGSEIEGLIDDIETIPNELPTEPLPTKHVKFDVRNEQRYISIAKTFGKLKIISDVKLSLMPKEIDSHVFDDDEEEDLLPIDNSNLSKLVKQKVAA